MCRRDVFMPLNIFRVLAIICLITSCASTSNDNIREQKLIYGECDVIELERITYKLAREKYPHRDQVVRFPFMFKDLGDRLRFFTAFPVGYNGGSPTTEFDKETCELIRIYETE